MEKGNGGLRYGGQGQKLGKTLLVVWTRPPIHRPRPVPPASQQGGVPRASPSGERGPGRASPSGNQGTRAALVHLPWSLVQMVTGRRLPLCPFLPSAESVGGIAPPIGLYHWSGEGKPAAQAPPPGRCLLTGPSRNRPFRPAWPWPWLPHRAHASLPRAGARRTWSYDGRRVRPS